MIKFNLFDYINILSFKIERGVNVHSTCFFSMLIQDEDSDSIISHIGDIIEVSYDESDIFSGFVESVQIFKDMKKTIVNVTASSLSKKIDLKRNSRIYQDTKQTYKSIVDALDIDCIDPVILDDSLSNEVLERIIVQHDETDFNFIKRLSGNKGLPVIIDDISNSTPSMWIGKREGHKLDLDEGIAHSLRITHNNTIFMFLTKYNINYTVGDLVNFNGNEYWVVKVNIFYKNSILYADVVAELDFKQSVGKTFSDSINLTAKVVDNKDKDNKGRVQVEFVGGGFEDIFSDNRYWFHVISPYSSANKAYYSIPGVDELVYVCIGVNDVNYVLPTQSNVASKFLTDPSHINMVVSENIGLKLDEGLLIIENDKTSFFLEDKSIQQVSNELKSKISGDVSIESKSYSLKCESDIKTKTSGGSIESQASSNINLKGSNIKLN